MRTEGYSSDFADGRKKTMKANSEYGRFERMVDSLLKVSHKDLQKKMNAEESAKKRKKSKKSSASREASGRA
jgi:hypothetical protein